VRDPLWTDQLISGFRLQLVGFMLSFAVAGERNPFDGRILFPGLLGQPPYHDDG